MFGWRERFNAPCQHRGETRYIGAPASSVSGRRGVTGLTAWDGLLKIAALKSGDVVFCLGRGLVLLDRSPAQIAKLKGNTVIDQRAVRKVRFSQTHWRRPRH